MPFGLIRIAAGWEQGSPIAYFGRLGTTYDAGDRRGREGARDRGARPHRRLAIWACEPEGDEADLTCLALALNLLRRPQSVEFLSGANLAAGTGEEAPR